MLGQKIFLLGGGIEPLMNAHLTLIVKPNATFLLPSPLRGRRVGDERPSSK